MCMLCISVHVQGVFVAQFDTNVPFTSPHTRKPTNNSLLNQLSKACKTCLMSRCYHDCEAYLMFSDASPLLPLGPSVRHSARPASPAYGNSPSPQLVNEMTNYFGGNISPSLACVLPGGTCSLTPEDAVLAAED